MAINTTVYNNDNAISLGYYYNSKGDRIPVEIIGSYAECMNSVEGLNEGVAEIQHRVIRENIRSCTPVYTSFTLHNHWK